jgi:hypothetical protein
VNVIEDTWTHGTRLGRAHRSVGRHLVEDHGTAPGWVETASPGSVHGKHDRLHAQTWAYADDLPHGPAVKDTP